MRHTISEIHVPTEYQLLDQRFVYAKYGWARRSGGGAAILNYFVGGAMCGRYFSVVSELHIRNQVNTLHTIVKTTSNQINLVKPQRDIHYRTTKRQSKHNGMQTQHDHVNVV